MFTFKESLTHQKYVHLSYPLNDTWKSVYHVYCPSSVRKRVFIRAWVLPRKTFAIETHTLPKCSKVLYILAKPSRKGNSRPRPGTPGELTFVIRRKLLHVTSWYGTGRRFELNERPLRCIWVGSSWTHRPLMLSKFCRVLGSVKMWICVIIETHLQGMISIDSFSSS